MTPRAVAPPALAPGSRIGVAALSGNVDSEAFARGVAALEALEWRPSVAGNATAAAGIFAGDDDQRLAGFHELLRDPEVEAVFFARGGHGLLRLLPHLDWQLIASRPRWFVGYSDVTPLLNEVVRRCGWIALHGPLVAVEFADGLHGDETASLVDILGGRSRLSVPLSGTTGDWSQVEAPLTGGCLSLLTATLGTDNAFDACGSVLLLEDVGEPLYRIDRMLQQLRLAGALDGLAGVVVGELTASDRPDDSPGAILEALEHAAGGSVSIAWGCPIGHCRPNYTLPLGALAAVDPVAGSLELAIPASATLA